jgi:hypothetical protein
MSYEIVKNIAIKDGIIYLESAPNNIEPVLFADNKSTHVNPSRHKDIYDSCFDAILTGEFQLLRSCKGDIADAITKTLGKDYKYGNVKWFEDHYEVMQKQGVKHPYGTPEFNEIKAKCDAEELKAFRVLADKFHENLGLEVDLNVAQQQLYVVTEYTELSNAEPNHGLIEVDEEDIEKMSQLKVGDVYNEETQEFSKETILHVFDNYEEANKVYQELENKAREERSVIREEQSKLRNFVKQYFEFPVPVDDVFLETFGFPIDNSNIARDVDNIISRYITDKQVLETVDSLKMFSENLKGDRPFVIIKYSENANLKKSEQLDFWRADAKIKDLDQKVREKYAYSGGGYDKTYGTVYFREDSTDKQQSSYEFRYDIGSATSEQSSGLFNHIERYVDYIRKNANDSATVNLTHSLIRMKDVLQTAYQENNIFADITQKQKIEVDEHYDVVPFSFGVSNGAVYWTMQDNGTFVVKVDTSTADGNANPTRNRHSHDLLGIIKKFFPYVDETRDEFVDVFGEKYVNSQEEAKKNIMDFEIELCQIGAKVNNRNKDIIGECEERVHEKKNSFVEDVVANTIIIGDTELTPDQKRELGENKYLELQNVAGGVRPEQAAKVILTLSDKGELKQEFNYPIKKITLTKDAVEFTEKEKFDKNFLQDQVEILDYWIKRSKETGDTEGVKHYKNQQNQVSKYLTAINKNKIKLS